MDAIALESDHIEAAAWRAPLESATRQAWKKPLCRPYQSPLLGRAHAPGGPAKPGSLARPHFDENELVAIARHQIDLAQRAPQVARQALQAGILDQPQRGCFGVHAALLGRRGRGGHAARWWV